MNLTNQNIDQDTHQNIDRQVDISFIENGGVTSAKGFKASGVHAGFRANPNKLDLALVVADEPCAAAAIFTQNVFCAAPVQFSKQQLESSSGNAGYGTARAIVINSGNANAATGINGIEKAKTEAGLVADTVGCQNSEVLVASTGVIGVELPLTPFEAGIPAACKMLSESGGKDAATAIMTTDTYSKECAVTFNGDGIGFPNCNFTVGGMAKGSGMIMPNMATMIAVITTDAPVKQADLYKAIKKAASVSFNKVTVDSDTSTNDTCFILASGEALKALKDNSQSSARVDAGANTNTNAGTSANIDSNADASSNTNTANAHASFEYGTLAFEVFTDVLIQVCTYLARSMAKDGEGATKLVTVNLKGAKDAADADKAARAVANSPLVKTAIAGHDANWGRIAAALGKSGAVFSQTDVDIDIMGMSVCKKGLTQAFDEDEALRRFEDPEIVIDIDLGQGEASTTIWTCDLTHDYISINADYRS